MRTLIQDLRYGLRVMRGNKGFTLAAVITLAVAIAASTAVFSWLDTVWLQPFPGIRDASRVVAFETVGPEPDSVNISYTDFRDYRDNLQLVSGVAVSLQPNALRIGEGEHARRVWSELVSGNYFEVLGVEAQLGRVFNPEEYGDAPGAYPVAVISDRLWRSQFQADPGVVGRTIPVNRQQLTIIGVAPPDFVGTTRGLRFDMWAPLMMGLELDVMNRWVLEIRQSRGLQAVARLAPGVTIEQAREEMTALARQLAAAYPDTNEGFSATLLKESEAHSGAQDFMLGPLSILMAMCLVVLLIACVNVSNLLSARAASRRKELSVRLALGASRGRITRQMITEALLLSGLGAALSVPLAMWISPSLLEVFPPTGLPIWLDIQMNAKVFGFMILICAASTLVSGLAPALDAMRQEVSETLKESGRGADQSSGSQRTRSLLVVSEVALALVALVSAGLLLKSFDAASSIDPGFDPHNVQVSRFTLSTEGYSPQERQQFCLRLRERLESAPGIIAVSYADMIPLGLGMGPGTELQIEGYIPGRGENMDIDRTLVSPGHFGLMRIPLVQGRDFTTQDDANAPPVMIVNEAFAERFFNSGYPIGRTVHAWGREFTVVGMVRTIKYYKITEAPRPYFFAPVQQTEVPPDGTGITFYLRTASSPDEALATLRREAAAIDPDVTPLDSMPLAEYIGASLFPQKVAASLLSALAAIALLLVTVGLYSVMAYAVTQRTHEIGIRIALGAQSLDVLGMVVRQGMILTAAGLLAGVALALAGTRLISGVLINVSATDPLIITGAALFLGLVTLLASYLPARRAIKVNPVTALRIQ